VLTHRRNTTYWASRTWVEVTSRRSCRVDKDNPQFVRRWRTKIIWKYEFGSEQVPYLLWLWYTRAVRTPWRELWVTEPDSALWATNHPYYFSSSAFALCSQTYDCPYHLVDNVLGPSGHGLISNSTRCERHLTCYGIESRCAHRLYLLMKSSIRNNSPNTRSDHLTTWRACSFEPELHGYYNTLGFSLQYTWRISIFKSYSLQRKDKVSNFILRFQGYSTTINVYSFLHWNTVFIIMKIWLIKLISKFRNFV